MSNLAAVRRNIERLKMSHHYKVALVTIISLMSGCQPNAPAELRLMTLNVEDIRTSEILEDSERLHEVGQFIMSLEPDIFLLNEITFDYAADGSPAGLNGQRFADLYVNSLLPDNGGGRYVAVMVESNTGIPSGFDLDNNGAVFSEVVHDDPVSQRLYGNDSFGYGIFPGQYAMALFVREPFAIDKDRIQTFQHFKWSAMPDALAPEDSATGQGWYSDDEWASLRLSSKNHWVAPIDLGRGREFHVVSSHPTPPAFDGPEARNKKRNHDEIRLLSAMIDGATWLSDDDGSPISLSDKSFVILGDLNADPDEGSSIDNPIGRFLFDHPRVNGEVVPVADAKGTSQYPWLDPDDTAFFRMRVDYVLPSSDLRVMNSGLYRPDSSKSHFSDHFPVWVDVEID